MCTVELRCGGQACIYYFDNINGAAVSDLTSNSNFPNNPTSTVSITSGAFESKHRNLENYGVLMEGFVVAPHTGSYTFSVDSDDASEVWAAKSPNALDMAGDMLKVVEQPGCCAKITGTVSVVWSANQRYYVKALMKEAAGT